MKTILLAGATALDPADDEPRMPNAMVEIGGRPVITRVMDVFSHFGARDFIVAAGGRSIMLKQFFSNYHLLANDLTVNISSGRVELQPVDDVSWTVSVVDTGTYTSDSGRVRQLRSRIGAGTFMLSYADTLGNVDIDALLAFHRSHGKLATVTAVRPPVRSGALDMRGDRVVAYTRQLRGDDSWINGGYFVLEPEVFDYLVDDAAPLERAAMAQLALDGELMAYRHSGFWQPLDSARDRRLLNSFCTGDVPPWLRFDEAPPNVSVLRR